MRLTKVLPVALACFGTGLFADDSGLFSELDTSGDGVVEKSEVGEERARFFDRLVRVGDANEDGKLSKEEFDAALVDEPAATPPPEGRRGMGGRRGGMEGRQMPSPAEIIERLDTSGDGKIQRDELTDRARMLGMMMDRMGVEELTSEQLEEAGRRMREARGMGRPGEGGPEGRPGRPEGDRGRGPRPPAEMDGEQAKAGGDRYRDRERFRPEGGDADFRDRKSGDRERGGERGDRGPGRGPGFGPPRDGEHHGPAFVRLLDENHDGHITKLEAVRLIEKFGELDTNDDGHLDMQELMGVDRRHGPPMANRDGGEGRPGPGGPQGRMRDGDRPNDVGRGRPEMDGGERGRPGPGRGGMERDGRPGRGGFGGRGGDPKEFFDRMDADGNGSISKDELPPFLTERFDTMDKNGDGEITPDEFGRPGRGGERPGGGRGGERPKRPASDDAA